MKADFRKLYATYNRYYKEVEKKSPVEMSDKMTRLEFRTYYTAMKNARDEQIEAGTRTTRGAIIRDMVHEQQNFEMTVAQARKAAQAAKMFRMSEKFKDFRTDKQAGKMLSNLLKNYKASLLRQGKTNQQANMEVSEYFFGS